MATIPRNALYTRIPNRDSRVALDTTLRMGTSTALLLFAATTTLPRPPFFTRFYPVRLPADLCGFVQPSQFSLRNVQPVAGFGWMDTPDQVRRQPPEYSGRNVSLLGSPAQKPFNQNDWPIPEQYKVDRHAHFRGFMEWPLPVIPPAPGAPLSCNFLINGANPRLNVWTPNARFEAHTQDALSITPPVVAPHEIIRNIYLGIRPRYGM